MKLRLRKRDINILHNDNGAKPAGNDNNDINTATPRTKHHATNLNRFKKNRHVNNALKEGFEEQRFASENIEVDQENDFSLHNKENEAPPTTNSTNAEILKDTHCDGKIDQNRSIAIINSEEGEEKHFHCCYTADNIEIIARPCNWRTSNQGMEDEEKVTKDDNLSDSCNTLEEPLCNITGVDGDTTGTATLVEAFDDNNITSNAAVDPSPVPQKIKNGNSSFLNSAGISKIFRRNKNNHNKKENLATHTSQNNKVDGENLDIPGHVHNDQRLNTLGDDLTDTGDEYSLLSNLPKTVVGEKDRSKNQIQESSPPEVDSNDNEKQQVNTKKFKQLRKINKFFKVKTPKKTKASSSPHVPEVRSLDDADTGTEYASSSIYSSGIDSDVYSGVLDSYSDVHSNVDCSTSVSEKSSTENSENEYDSTGTTSASTNSSSMNPPNTNSEIRNDSTGRALTSPFNSSPESNSILASVNGVSLSCSSSTSSSDSELSEKKHETKEKLISSEIHASNSNDNNHCGMICVTKGKYFNAFRKLNNLLKFKLKRGSRSVHTHFGLYNLNGKRFNDNDSLSLASLDDFGTPGLDRYVSIFQSPEKDKHKSVETLPNPLHRFPRRVVPNIPSPRTPKDKRETIDRFSPAKSERSIETTLVAHRIHDISNVKNRFSLPEGPKKQVRVSHGRPPMAKRTGLKKDAKDIYNTRSKRAAFSDSASGIEVESIRPMDTPADLVFSFSDTNLSTRADGDDLIIGHIVSTSSSCVRVEIPSDLPSDSEDESLDSDDMNDNASKSICSNLSEALGDYCSF